MENGKLKVDNGWTYGVLDDAVNKGSSNISLNKIKKDDGEFPVYGAKGYVQNVSFYQQESEYLGIIKDGAGIGRVSKHPAKSSILATMQYIIPINGFDIQFVNYFLNYIDFEKYRTGSTIPHIYYKDYKSEPFPLIPLAEQKRIVAKLDELFALIENGKLKVEKLLADAKELFQSQLNEIFSNGKLKVENGKWVEKTLGEVCEKIQDGAHSSPKIQYDEKSENRFLYITSKNIRNNYLKLSNISYVDEAFHNSIYPRCNPEYGDILITKDGANTGNITLNTLKEPFSLLSSVCLIKTNQTLLLPSFLKGYIQSPIGFKNITGKMTGTAIKRIILKTIKKAVIPLPDLDTQLKIVKMLDELYDNTQALESKYQQELDALDELKKSILQKAFNGEL